MEEEDKSVAVVAVPKESDGGKTHDNDIVRAAAAVENHDVVCEDDAIIAGEGGGDEEECARNHDVVAEVVVYDEGGDENCSKEAHQVVTDEKEKNDVGDASSIKTAAFTGENHAAVNEVTTDDRTTKENPDDSGDSLCEETANNVKVQADNQIISKSSCIVAKKDMSDKVWSRLASVNAKLAGEPMEDQNTAATVVDNLTETAGGSSRSKSAAAADSKPTDDDVASEGRNRLRLRRRRIDSSSSSSKEEFDPHQATSPMEQDEAGTSTAGGRRRSKIRRHVSTDSSSTTTTSSSSSTSSPSSFGMRWSEDDENEDANETDDGPVRGGAAATDEPRPEVLSKEKHRCRTDMLRDIIKREMAPSAAFHRRFVLDRMRSANLVSRLSLERKLIGHTGCVNTLHFNRSGSLLASGSDDLDVIVWDWADGKRRVGFDSGHKANVFQAKFLPFSGDTHIVSTSRDGQVRLAELSSGCEFKSTRKLASHRGPANKLALLPDSPHSFLSGGEDGLVLSLDVRQSRPNKLLVHRDGERKVAIYSIDANPVNSNMFCTSGRDHFVRLFDRRYVSMEEAKPLKKYCPQHMLSANTNSHVTCAVFSHDGSEVIGSYNDDDIYLFNTDHSDGADFVKHYQGHRNNATVKGVNFYGPSSEFVVSGSDCGNVFLWSKETEAIVNMFKGDESGVVNVLEPHPNLPYLATSGLDDEVKIWLPTAQNEIDEKKIEKAVIRNVSEQRRRRDAEPESFDGQMLWVLWRQIRRSEERRRRRGERSARGQPDEEEEEEEEEEETSSEDEEAAGGVQCPTS